MNFLNEISYSLFFVFLTIWHNSTISKLNSLKFFMG